jgi:hypothetical protein
MSVLAHAGQLAMACHIEQAQCQQIDGERNTSIFQALVLCIKT